MLLSNMSDFRNVLLKGIQTKNHTSLRKNTDRWRGLRKRFQRSYLLTYLLTHILTISMEQSPSWEAYRFSASQGLLAFYGARRFITAFTSAHQLSLSWARSIQPILQHPTSWRSVFVLSSHLRLGLSSCFRFPL